MYIHIFERIKTCTHVHKYTHPYISTHINIHNQSKSKLKPRIIVLGVGGGGCNALNTMIASGLKGV